jgi:hypothetical protein
MPSFSARTGPSKPLPPARWLAVLRDRQPTLTAYALAMLLLMLPTLGLLALDERTIREVPVWSKPLKFMASTAGFALSTAWFMGLLPAHARSSPVGRGLVWAVILSSLFEVGYISVQAALGQPSHYFVADRFHAAMFGLMALAAVVLTGTQALLAWQIARQAPSRPWPLPILAVVVGMVLTCLLSTVSGFMLGARQAPAGVGLPLVGWHLGGDLRPAHFLAVHAQQLIPLAGWLLQARAGVSAGRWFAGFVTAYLLAWGLLASTGLRGG